ncbi:hypothetical protein HGO34_13390 [Agrobacterium vitis]|uniref:Uncharacterized protein n=1 Tax=Agrobacterium vitis TaxID=373 RepID=A0AAE4WHW1_AGRVI|nr:hypothetical protein [Agrobacterium vitis]MCF1499641.1 hypothetical protein [Allorhizobium sp. Av2]MCM2440709.1 hypothetical protein [Agrobacterium vitis]MUZ59312.1 hypothetical protein [Agrobacterium vitis]MVA66543.1 hypothetical protein [Agrobacterium vitis]MVA87404.1 hypothetical protein [Agrobacterium vitis]
MNRFHARLCAELERQLASPGCIPRLPVGSEILWSWFQDLNQTRSFGFSAPNAITYGEIDAYARLTGAPIAPRHVAALLAMDAAYLRFHQKRQSVPDGVKTLPPVSKVPLSAGLIDAMFG